jgi:hypothetical protein
MTKRTIILIGFIVLKFLLQYSLISNDYDLQRDEYLHLDQANHLAWGYLSIPPVTSWIAFVIKLLGNSIFWIKFFPALFGALTIFIVWKAIEELNGNLFALVLGATCVLLSAILRINILFQPNSLDVLSWTVFYYCALKYFKTENSRWLYIGAVVFAIGFLNKYNIGFLVLAFFPAVLFTKQRSIFTKRSFYLAAVVAFLLILPNLLWQYNNHFPVVHHMKLLAETQLVHVERSEFLKNQLLFFTGSLFVLIAALYALIAYKPFEKYRSFAWAFVFTLAVFTYFKAKDYYAVGLYPIYLSFGAVFLSNLLKDNWKRYLRPIAIALPILVFIPLYQIAFPNKTPGYILQHPKQYKELGLLRWEDGKEHALPQDFADMLGWKELAMKLDTVCAQLPDPGQTFILCDNYGQAGAINYYSKNKKIVAQSFHADYLDWLKYDKKIVDAVLVKENDDEDKERKTEISLFDTVYLAAQRINKFAREDTISIYVLRGAKVDVNKRILEEAERKKSYW